MRAPCRLLMVLAQSWLMAQKALSDGLRMRFKGQGRFNSHRRQPRQGGEALLLPHSGLKSAGVRSQALRIVCPRRRAAGRADARRSHALHKAASKRSCRGAPAL